MSQKVKGVTMRNLGDTVFYMETSYMDWCTFKQSLTESIIFCDVSFEINMTGSDDVKAL